MTTFINQVTEGILALRPNLKVEVKKIFKNNDIEKNGITIIDKTISTSDGYCISPMIYMEEFYNDYISSKATMNEIVESILSIYDIHKGEVEFDVNSFLDYNWVKPRLAIDIIGPANVKRLKDVPTIPYLNLHVGVRVMLNNYADGSMSISVRNEHLERWGIKIEEAVAQALENDEDDCVIQSLEDVLRSLLKREGMPDDLVKDFIPEEGFIPMYVISSKSRYYGVKNLFTHVGLRKMAEKFDNDLFVIPSSTHDLLCFSYDENIEPSNLVDLIKHVNATEVSPDEILSDTLYFYSKHNDEVSIIECLSDEEVDLDA